MRSAYLVLGVPGDAKSDEIETAFQRGELLFTRERLAADPGAAARLDDLKAAYRVLRDPETRAAHDRKLAAAMKPQPLRRTVLVEVSDEASPMRKVMTAGIWVLALALAAGMFVTYRNAEARKELAAQELAARVSAEQEERRKAQELAQAAAQRAQATASAEAAERQLSRDAQYSAARAAADMRSQEALAASVRRVELSEVQRAEANRLSEDRRAAQEARMRTERDKQRVRELCIQLYRRPDC